MRPGRGPLSAAVQGPHIAQMPETARFLFVKCTRFASTHRATMENRGSISLFCQLLGKLRRRAGDLVRSFRGRRLFFAGFSSRAGRTFTRFADTAAISVQL